MDVDTRITPFPGGANVILTEAVAKQRINIDRLMHLMSCRNSCDDCKRRTAEREEAEALELKIAVDYTAATRSDFEDALKHGSEGDVERAFSALRTAIIEEEYLRNPYEE